MSALSICILAAIAVFAGFVAGYLFGLDAGLKDGRAEEWCSKYFSDIARDKARRDSGGRFKAKHDSANFPAA